MQIQTYEQRVLIAEEGMWLYNEKSKTIGRKVYLGKDADASEWTEITQEAKETLESEWEQELETE